MKGFSNRLLKNQLLSHCETYMMNVNPDSMSPLIYNQVQISSSEEESDAGTIETKTLLSRRL